MNNIVTKDLVKTGFIAAGVMNISGVLLFSRELTNEAINNADPVVMSNFGLLMIMIWGLTYIAAAMTRTDLKWLAGVFALEKLIYVLAWVNWITAHSLQDLREADFMAVAFYSIYGINDLVFMMFFAWIFMRNPNVNASRMIR